MSEPIRIMTEPVPESISADELAFHRQVNYELRIAQGMARLWTDHLAVKYNLGNGDQILTDGTIRRLAPGG